MLRSSSASWPPFLSARWLVAGEPGARADQPRAWYERYLVGVEVGPTGAQFGTQAMREHPEFRMVGADGAPIDRVCFNSGYLTLGAGRVVTFAASPGFATASEHHIVEARRLIRNAVRYLNPAPVVAVDAPANVEVVVTEEPAAPRIDATVEDVHEVIVIDY